MVGDWAIERLSGRCIAFTMATTHEFGPELQRRIRPLITGVGPVEAGVAVAIGLEQLSARGAVPDLIVSIGSAGSQRCRLGAVYQASSVTWRDMDATALGFARGATPFLDLPVELPLVTPFAGVPLATLSTGADVVVGDRYGSIAADMVDMESYAVLRACQRFGVGLASLRGISDGPGSSTGAPLDWTALLPDLDRKLAAAVDRLS